jgi:hypothetical protein
MRVVFTGICLAAAALVAESAVSSQSPEAAVSAAYAADALALQRGGAGVIGDPAARERFFSRSLLRAIETGEMEAVTANAASRIPADPFSDSGPHLVDLRITPVSEDGASAKVLAEFARGDGAREQLTYALVFERREWRIDDISYGFLDGEKRTLREGIVAK